jgi:cell division protein FtsZ
LNEVQLLMEEFNKQISDQTRILFGVSVDPRMRERLSVTILSSLPAESSLCIAPVPLPARAEAPAAAQAREPQIAREEELLPEPCIAYVDTDEQLNSPAPAAELPAMPLRALENPPAVPRKSPVTTKAKPAAADGKREVKQEQMQFEPVTRGRFEKSEPTIVDGQDLDVPTFLRRNVRAR